MHEFGPPLVLIAEEVADPVREPGQVMIDVAFASITFVETRIRAGVPPNPAMLPQLPVVLGNGVGGVTSGGRRVIASLNRTGGYAERAVAVASVLIDILDTLATQDAVAPLADGRTALLVMRAADVQAGETVLVEAAAGGVGHLLVQLARRAGARVIGAAGGERKAQVVLELGADLALDYSKESWGERLRGEVGGVDVVFDGVGGHIAHAAMEALKPGGRLCAFGMASGSFAEAEPGINVVRLPRATPEELRHYAQTAIAEAVAGRLRPLIGQTFPLPQAAAAHAAVERRVTIGRTLLEVAGQGVL
jgi:NADPH:quinone reductase